MCAWWRPRYCNACGLPRHFELCHGIKYILGKGPGRTVQTYYIAKDKLKTSRMIGPGRKPVPTCRCLGKRGWPRPNGLALTVRRVHLALALERRRRAEHSRI